MNSMIFFGGLGAGAVITTILFLLVINRLVASRSKLSEKIEEYNMASVAELKRRNDIGTRQSESLGKIAEWYEHNWNGFRGN